MPTLAKHLRPASRECFKIAIICALTLEHDAIESLFDVNYEENEFFYGKATGDLNCYTIGRIGDKDVVLASMYGMGMVSASAVAVHLKHSFKGVRIVLVVGICGGVPKTPEGTDIWLGDVLISSSMIQIDFGRQYPATFIRKAAQDIQGASNFEIRTLMNGVSTLYGRQQLQARMYRHLVYTNMESMSPEVTHPGVKHDRLYLSEYRHKHRWKTATQDDCSCINPESQEDDVCCTALQSDCELLGCDDSILTKRERTQKVRMSPPVDGKNLTSNIPERQNPSVHVGRLACINQIIKDASYRDKFVAEHDVIGFEMDSAGVWDYFPTIVIKGVCDYSDGHRSRQWQSYAAATAAACTRAMLEEWTSTDAFAEKSTQSDNKRIDDSTLPQDAPVQAPFSVPFPRDIDFVDDGIVLNQISQRCSAPGSRIALLGLGGVGKTQLAIEYAYRIREQSPTTPIFWVYASSAARFEQSFREFANQADIPGRNDPDSNIFQLVRNWLRYHTAGDWLLILDNLDTLEAFEAWDKQVSVQGLQPLTSYIPHGPYGSIIVTTRARDVASRLVDAHNIIHIDPMDKQSSLVLLRKKLRAAWREDSLEAATKLVEVLECMPMAIVQAGAFIFFRSPRYSIEQYLKSFMQSDTGKVSLLNHNDGNLRRDREAPNSIMLTWQISFDHIVQENEFSADLLSLMSFFDCRRIPETLLKGESSDDAGNVTEHKSDSASNTVAEKSAAYVLQQNSDHVFENAIDMLRGYSLITVGVDNQTFEMHALVQLATRFWLKKHGTVEKWNQQAINNLYAVFPVGESNVWDVCQALFPHVKALVSQQLTNPLNSRNWASLLYRAAEYAIQKGNVKDAITMSTMSLQARSEMFGTQNVDTMASMSLLGSAYSLGGQWTRAAELQVRVLQIFKDVLGTEHPSTLISMNDLSTTYQKQGRYAEAEQLCTMVVKSSKQVLGSDHPDTLMSMVNLASIYQVQGRYDRAEQLNTSAIERLRRVKGLEHPHTLTCMNNLTSTYYNQGRFQEAEQLNVQVLEVMKRVLGQEHPDTLSSLQNLALIYMAQHRYTQAEQLNLQLVECMTIVLGIEHPSTLTSMSNLAMVTACLERWSEAELLETQVMEVRMRVLGAEHPQTLASMHDLAVIWRKSGRAEKSLDLMGECWRLRQQVLGTHHPLTQDASRCLADWQT